MQELDKKRDFIYLAIEKCDVDLDQFIKNKSRDSRDNDDILQQLMEEEADNDTLQQLMEEADKDWQMADILQQLMKGVAYLHRKSIGELNYIIR